MDSYSGLILAKLCNLLKLHPYSPISHREGSLRTVGPWLQGVHVRLGRHHLNPLAGERKAADTKHQDLNPQLWAS